MFLETLLRGSHFSASHRMATCVPEVHLAFSGGGGGGGGRNTTVTSAHDERPLINAIMAALHGINQAAKLLPPDADRRKMYARKHDLLMWAIEHFEVSDRVDFSYQTGRNETQLLITLHGSKSRCFHIPARALTGAAHRIVVCQLGIPAAVGV